MAKWMPTDRVRWIHISDIDGDLGKLRESIEHIASVQADRPFDLIVVTGELLRAFDRDELVAVRSALLALRDRVTVSGVVPKLVIVPGEQDRVEEGSSVAARVFERWFEDSELRTSFPEDPDLVKLAVQGFDPFWEIMSEAMPGVTKGLLPGDFSFTVTAPSGVRLGVVGLNSEFLAPAHRRGKRLRTLEGFQIEAAVGGKPEAFCASHDAVIVAVHAPLRSLDAHSIAALSKLVGEDGMVLTSPDGSSPGGLAVRDHVRSIPAIPFPDGVWFGEQIHSGGSVVHAGWAVRFRWSPALKVTFEGSLSLDERAGAPDSAPLPTTRLRRVSLKNFRSIEVLDIPLVAEPPSPLGGLWTCIAGINGAGKSSVLQAIALACMSEIDIGQIFPATKQRLRRFDGASSYDAEIELEWETTQGMMRRKVLIGQDGGVTMIGNPPSSLPLVLGYGATRNLSDAVDSVYRDASRTFRQVSTLFNPLTQVAHAEALLTQRRDPRLWSIVSQIASAALGAEFSVEMRGEKLLFGGKEGIDALHLPDGFRSMLAWLTDLAAAWCEGDESRSDDISEIEVVALVDEIDLHMHPSLQRDLVPRLRRAMPRVQWVVTTHSPLVLGSFHESEIVPLDAKSPGGIRKVDRSILGFSVNQIIQWLMGTTPVSGELERQIAREPRGGLDKGTIETLLETSPDMDADQANAKVTRRRELLAKLRKGEL